MPGPSPVLHVQSTGQLTTACQQLQLALAADFLFKLVPAVHTVNGETGTDYDAWLSLTAICRPDKRTPSAELCCVYRRNRLLHPSRRQASQVAQPAAHCTSGPALQSPSWALPWCPSPVQQIGCLCLPFMRRVHTPEPEVGSQILPSCLVHWLSCGERLRTRTSFLFHLHLASLPCQC